MLRQDSELTGIERLRMLIILDNHFRLSVVATVTEHVLTFYH